VPLPDVAPEVEASQRVVLRRYAQYALDRLMILLTALSAFLFALAVAVTAIRFGWPHFVRYLGFVAPAVVTLGGSAWVEIVIPHLRHGATPAMRWLGLRIRSLDGEQPPLRDFFLRWLVSIVDDLFFGLLGAVMIAVTPRHQRLGDIVARTVVVRAD
jgi:uncharacterized RDD family membrane protein YckC